MTNKKLGNRLERQICWTLSDDGWWVTLLNQGTEGQPADIIAVKGNKSLLVDAKWCTNGTFKFSRIEPNQESAMDLWKQCTGREGWFAISFGSVPYMIDLPTLRKFNERKSSITIDDIKDKAMTMEEWLKHENCSE